MPPSRIYLLAVCFLILGSKKISNRARSLEETLSGARPASRKARMTWACFNTLRNTDQGWAVCRAHGETHRNFDPGNGGESIRALEAETKPSDEGLEFRGFAPEKTAVFQTRGSLRGAWEQREAVMLQGLRGGAPGRSATC